MAFCAVGRNAAVSAMKWDGDVRVTYRVELEAHLVASPDKCQGRLYYFFLLHAAVVSGDGANTKRKPVK